MKTEINGTTFDVAPRDADWYYCAIVEWRNRDDETDYLDGYATGDEPTRTKLREFTACRHSWVAGMMSVDNEDLESIAAARRVECEKCDAVYGRPEKPLYRILEWKTSATPQGAHADEWRPAKQEG